MLDSERGAGRTAELPDQSARDPLELRQTRELTAQEWREFMRLLRKHASPRPTSRWLSAVSILWWLVAAFFALSIVAAVQSLHSVAPDLALQIAIAGIAFCILLFGFDKVVIAFERIDQGSRILTAFFSSSPMGYVPSRA